jgi:photosystem II stability/assembly factor-like uncharacterized protein
MTSKLLIVTFLLVFATPALASVWFPIDSGVDAALRDLYFHDASRGVAVGALGTVIITSDGGETWAAPEGSLPGNQFLWGVCFGDSLRGVIVGKGGAVWWTADGGQHWAAGLSNTLEDLLDVAMFSSLDGLAVGRGGTVLRTTDGGANWTALASGTTKALMGVSTLNASTAIAVGDFTILRTADGGDSWSEIAHPMGNSWLIDVAFSDSLRGIAVGDFATVLRTADGGLSWTLEHSSGDDAENFSAVAMRDTSNAIAVGTFDGGRQNALRTNDGGRNWSLEHTGYGRSLRSVVYRGDLLIATGIGGLMFKARDLVAVAFPLRPFALLQNRPNPFNPQTTIAFELPNEQAVSLRVFDVSGRLVRVLVDGEVYGQGHSEAVWNGRDDTGRRVSSGTYFYHLEVGEYSETKRMALVK